MHQLKIKDIEVDKNDQEFIGELIGLFVGDGCAYYYKPEGKYSIRFTFNITEFLMVNEITYLFNKKFGKKPLLLKQQNRLIVRYNSKKLMSFILNYIGWNDSFDCIGRNRKSRTVYLKEGNYNTKFKLGFLRGFMDSDGYVSANKINFDSASEKIIMQAGTFLRDLDFKDFKISYYKEKRNNRVGMYRISLRRSEHGKFLRLIKPRKAKMRLPGFEPG